MEENDIPINCLSDCPNSILETEKWGFVVSNYPHYPVFYKEYLEWTYGCPVLKYSSTRSSIGMSTSFLSPGGTPMIQEYELSTCSDGFIPMIEKNGFEIIGVFKAKPFSLIENLARVKNPKRIKRCLRSTPYNFIWSRLHKERTA